MLEKSMARLHFELQVNPGRSRFGHSITYNRCLHETGTKSIWDDLVSVVVLFIIDFYMRPGWKMFRPV